MQPLVQEVPNLWCAERWEEVFGEESLCLTFVVGTEGWVDPQPIWFNSRWQSFCS